MLPWLYQNKEFTSADISEKSVGFVYIITNLTNDRKYVGKKKFRRPKIVTKNKKKKKTQVESDWQQYCGSSKELQSDVMLLGEDNFKREILHLCNSKGWLNFLELTEQLQRNVLLDDSYYNQYVGSRIHRKHLKK